MSKVGGLAQKLLVGGYDISGDVQSLEGVGGGPALGDFTTIDQQAHARQGLLRDGALTVATLMDPALAHPVLASLPTTDTQALYMLNPLGVGAPAMGCVARQVDYDVTRAANGMLSMKTKFTSDGFGIEMNGVALTSGVRADTGATNGTSWDQGQGFTTPAVPASGVHVPNISPLPASVTVTGGTVTNVQVNGVSVGTGDGTYTLPSGQYITLTYSVAPTWTWTLQTAYGAQGYLQVTAFTGTSVTVTIQHSPDNSTWSTLTAFTAVTAAPAFQRAVATGTVGRYLRVITTGTFTAASFGCAAMVNVTAVTF